MFNNEVKTKQLKSNIVVSFLCCMFVSTIKQTENKTRIQHQEFKLPLLYRPLLNDRDSSVFVETTNKKTRLKIGLVRFVTISVLRNSLQARNDHWLSLMQRRVLVASLGLRCGLPSWINRPVRIGRHLLASIETRNGKRSKPKMINDCAWCGGTS